MVTTSGLGNGFPTSIWQEKKKKKKKEREREKRSTACPAHCAKKKQPSDSAEEDDGGGGGGGGGWASMLGRAELEEIHLVKDRDWRGLEGETGGGLWRSSVTK